MKCANPQVSRWSGILLHPGLTVTEQKNAVSNRFAFDFNSPLSRPECAASQRRGDSQGTSAALQMRVDALHVGEGFVAKQNRGSSRPPGGAQVGEQPHRLGLPNMRERNE